MLNNFVDSLAAIREISPLFLVEVIGDFDGTFAAVEDLSLDNSGGNYLCLSKTGKIAATGNCSITERYADSFEPSKEQNQAFKILRIPGRIKFISSDDGYSDTWSSLWLLTQCRHHIISNSSFYWWGAFLSAYYHPNEAQHIMASNNFANQAIYLDSWDQF